MKIPIQPVRPWFVVGGLAFLWALGGCASEEPPVPDTTAIVIEGASLWDGTGAPRVPDAVLVIDGDRIVAAGPAAEVDVPAGAAVVDATGLTLVPGLINGHGHVGMTRGLVEAQENYTPQNIQDTLVQYARYGVTAVFSLGTDMDPMREFRGPAGGEEAPRATVFSAGQGFTSPGGYPASLAQLNGVPNEVGTPEEARAQVGAMVDWGVDLVKIWVDDHFGRYDKIPPEVTAAIVDEAHAQGLPVYAHVFYLDDAKALVRAGIDGFAHNVRDQEVDQELIDLMLENQTFVMATLSREESTSMYASPPAFLDDPFFTRWADAGVIAQIKDPAYGAAVLANPDYQNHVDQFEMARINLARLHQAGVDVVFGTDTGPPGRFGGYFEHRELELMVEVGIPPAEALEIATRRTAEILGIGADFGTLEPGKRADFILLESNPLDDIRNTRTIAGVWIGGQVLALD